MRLLLRVPGIILLLCGMFVSVAVPIVGLPMITCGVVLLVSSSIISRLIEIQRSIDSLAFRLKVQSLQSDLLDDSHSRL